MAYKLTRYAFDGKISNLIDNAIVNRRLARSIEDTRVYRSAVIDVKSKDHHRVVSRVNLKLNFGTLTTCREVMMLVDSQIRS